MTHQNHYIYLVVVKTLAGMALNDLEEMWLQVDDKSVAKLVINVGMSCCTDVKGCNKINMMIMKQLSCDQFIDNSLLLESLTLSVVYSPIVSPVSPHCQ